MKNCSVRKEIRIPSREAVVDDSGKGGNLQTPSILLLSGQNGEEF